jgi:hypothetical protein
VARRLNVRCKDGGEVTAKKVVQWRKEITRGDAKAPATARATYEQARRLMLARYSNLLNGDDKQEICDRLATALVKAVAARQPRSAPKAANKAT